MEWKGWWFSTPPYIMKMVGLNFRCFDITRRTCFQYRNQNIFLSILPQRMEMWEQNVQALEIYERPQRWRNRPGDAIGVDVSALYEWGVVKWGTFVTFIFKLIFTPYSINPIHHGSVISKIHLFEKKESKKENNGFAFFPHLNRIGRCFLR